MFLAGDGKDSEPSTSSIQISQPCRLFEFQEILKATKNFAESLVIGNGGFGKVYKGNIVNGSSLVVAAIKRLDSISNQGAEEFWAEVKMLSMLRHCNLVSLFGYCKFEREMILVYEYMPNGTLEDHLHRLRSPLSWLQRLNICIGAGRGLHYLHTGTGITYGVIHRDVKSSNIFLHESWAAKISDFGLSKIGPTNQPSTYVNTLVKGTFGYMDPNYFTTGKLTRKSDVYAFGVLLLEVLCRKRPTDISFDEGLVTWVQDSIKEGNLKRIIDQDIRDEILPKCLKEFVRIAETCLHTSPKQRSAMAEVVVNLESLLALQEKYNNSMQSSWKTTFGRMVNMFSYATSRENTLQGNSNNNDPSMFPEMEEAVPAQFHSLSPSLKAFTFADLKKATRNFSLDLLLHKGDFRLFQAWVEQNTLAPSKQGAGVSVAVKRFYRHAHAQWLTEVNFLRHMDHPNIIRLLGYCEDEQERFLVYEHKWNNGFDRFLFSDAANMVEPLSWETRLLILIGVVRGFTYLHSRNVICGGLKSSDILLDEDFNAKLGVFGLVKDGHESWDPQYEVTRIVGFNTYEAPEYNRTGRLNMKCDIYGFGVLLLESTTGRKAVDRKRPTGKQNLVEWVTQESQVKINKRILKKIMDQRFADNYPVQGALECVALALKCVATKPKDRPSSEEVLHSLEEIHELKCK